MSILKILQPGIMVLVWVCEKRLRLRTHVTFLYGLLRKNDQTTCEQEKKRTKVSLYLI